MPGVLALAADIMTVVVGNPPLYTRLTQIEGNGRDARSCRTAYEQRLLIMNLIMITDHDHLMITLIMSHDHDHNH